MIAAQWLDVTIDRPPLPRRERTPLYEQAVAAAAQHLSDLEQREATAALYRVEDLIRVLDPAWPSVDQDTQPMPVQNPLLSSSDEPPFGSFWWIKARLTWRRRVAGGMSGLVLLFGLVGRWFV